LILVIDIGNTNIDCGLFNDTKNDYILLLSFRIATNKSMTTDEIGAIFSGILSTNNINLKLIKNAIFASVVPPLNHSIKKMSFKYFNIKIKEISKNKINNLKINYNTPDTIGMDRLVNSKAAVKIYSKNSIIVDFGTAITIDIVKYNSYIGGLIMPGIAVSLEALVNSTSMLPKIELQSPKNIIGKTTTESMQNGLYYLNVYGIDGIIRNIKSTHFNKIKNLKIISTGGLANFISEKSKMIKILDANLTLKGLKIIYDEI